MWRLGDAEVGWPIYDTYVLLVSLHAFPLSSYMLKVLSVDFDITDIIIVNNDCYLTYNMTLPHSERVSSSDNDTPARGRRY